MGSEESQTDVALVKGLMALNSKAYPRARKYLGMTGRPKKLRISRAMLGGRGTAISGSRPTMMVSL